ncbi:hypothetical protein [Caldalkalibacillus salinus]|nr:hypothetical protein [Caldalkalibacillus salinus]
MGLILLCLTLALMGCSSDETNRAYASEPMDIAVEHHTKLL